MKRFSVFSILIFFLVTGVYSQEMLVISPEGLNMRNDPSVNSAVRTVIPGKAVVIFLEDKGDEMTIQGAVGKWTKVMWQSKKAVLMYMTAFF